MLSNRHTSSEAGKETRIIQGKGNKGQNNNNQVNEFLKFIAARFKKIISQTITDNIGSMCRKIKQTQYFKVNYNS